MMHAYDESYLDDVMENLGNMMDYAVYDCGLDPDEFFRQFLLSGVADAVGRGNPKFAAGFSGPELAIEVVFRTTGRRLQAVPSLTFDKSPEFWAGWALAYYQWYTGKSFLYLAAHGLTMKKLIQWYAVLHECDLSKLVEAADELMKQNAAGITNLKCIRTARNFSQKELAEHSGVALRSIQLYEQRQNDINKAQAKTLAALAYSLGCRMEDLMEE